MPRPARRRQAQPALSQDAHSIEAFTRVSKGPVSKVHVSSRDKLAVGTATEAPATRKRKAAFTQDVQQDGIARRTQSFPPSSDEDEIRRRASLKRHCRRDDTPPQPQPRAKPAPKGKRVAKVPPSGVERAHRPSQSTILAEARRRGSTCRRPRIGAEAGLASRLKKSVDRSLPSHFAELVDLNRALLRTVVLHMAHNGRNAPLDVSSAIPNISRTWGKRKVTVADIRRCIAVQSYACEPGAASPLIVSNYGRGRICIELAPDRHGVVVDEERLCTQFRENLGTLCARRAVDDAIELDKDTDTDGDTKMDTDVDVLLQGLSIADLPQAAVADVAASAKTDLMLVKGQRALSQLKGGLVAKQQEREGKQQAHQVGQGSKMSLLERLRAKQLARANEPLPPTAEALQRRAALHRVGEVAATISMLSLSMPLSGRQAFTMAALSQKLRDSQRMPMSDDEAVACVRLIATEVAPEWLRLLRLGGRDNVVVQRGGQPTDPMLEDRVQRLLAA
ncbi:hypothetical protein XA68_11035 [Ophiocordyceps unilateralis]|uniref:DNA replication factor Cdt1 C-terminal domain-containing protein n=1 Tax=Ophiocordyceps unilateralis TaxID=268505 RepID=A0A2A9PHQ2_OPHUN|nr:hypothetical protein XA68_11035 [Ophiocordyceps unilateralis]